VKTVYSNNIGHFTIPVHYPRTLARITKGFSVKNATHISNVHLLLSPVANCWDHVDSSLRLTEFVLMVKLKHTVRFCSTSTPFCLLCRPFLLITNMFLVVKHTFLLVEKTFLYIFLSRINVKIWIN